MIILGIDPGTASTGYGIIKKARNLKCLGYGVIRTFPTSEKADRLKILNSELVQLIKRFRPEVLVIETLYFFKNLKTAIPVSQAGGVILLTAAKEKLPVYEFTPLQIKLAIAGFGLAEKKSIQKRIKSMLKLKELPKPDDAADALAVAVAFCLKNKRFSKIKQRRKNT